MNLIKFSQLTKLITTNIFKAILTISTIIIIILLFAVQMHRNTHTESLPHIKFSHDIIDEQTIKQITKNAIIINTGVYLEDFPKFSITKDRFIADLLVWFEFPKNKVSLEIIKYFAIENGNIITKSEPIIEHDKNLTTVKYHIRIDFQASMYYHHFPFNDHRITIQINNKHMNPKEMILHAKKESFVLAHDFHLPDWKIIHEKDKQKLEEFSGFIHSPLGPNKILFYPTAGFSFVVHNSGWLGILIIFIPLFLLFFLILSGLLLDISNRFRLSGTAAIVTTMVLFYRFNISNIAPQVGYLTIADKTYLTLVGLSSIILLYQIIICRISTLKTTTKTFLKNTIEKYDSILYCLTQIFIILGILIIFYAS